MRFNPLFIGACHRADYWHIYYVTNQVVSIPSSSGHVIGRKPGHSRREVSTRFNPLFIGACHRAWRKLSLASIQNTGFNPLFIGACHRARRKRSWLPSPEVVSIPSSSGHVIGHPQWQHHYRQLGVSIPSSSGHVIGPWIPNWRAVGTDGFNPLFIGACHRAWLPASPPGYALSFQSPLHRGMSSGAGSLPGLVTASSFNPLFIGACHRAIANKQISLKAACFNPLFIGACHRAPAEAGVQGQVRTVSIPSSSGHVIGRGPRQCDTRDRSDCFNPLFIGACHRAVPGGPRQCDTRDVSIPSSSGHVIGRKSNSSTTKHPPKFQSPLHRGMSSGRPHTPRYCGTFRSFNPLFIGACHRAAIGTTIRHAYSEVSIPSSSGHVIGHSEWSPAGRVSASFNPLFIGACHRAIAGMQVMRIAHNVSIPSSSGHVIGLKLER